MNKKTVDCVVKYVAGFVALVALLYGLVYVPSQQLKVTNMSVDRSETRVYNSCVLLAQQTTQQAVSQTPEGEEAPNEEQVNTFLNEQFVSCVAAEGFDPQELVDKYAPAAEEAEASTEA